MKYLFSLICFAAFLVGNISAALKSRIIGGVDADIRHHPYQASLRFHYRHFCGGAIIGPKHVLTAAHCMTMHANLHGPAYIGLSVSTGTGSSMEMGNVHRVARVTIYPGWSGVKEASFNNDLAILTLAAPIQFNEFQQKVALPSRDVVNGAGAVVTGWGHTVPKNGRSSIKLQKLQTSAMTNTECQLSYPNVNLYRSQMCSFHSMGHGSCVGDSGSPLVANNEIIGINSWIIRGDCAAGRPDVLANVYAYKDFIEQTMRTYN